MHRRSVSMTFAPKVRFGTKRPSITSTWIQSAPACSSIATSSASFAKSALRMDGAIRVALMAVARWRSWLGMGRLRRWLADDAELHRRTGDDRRAADRRLADDGAGRAGAVRIANDLHVAHADLREDLSRRAHIASHEVGHRWRGRPAAEDDPDRRRHARPRSRPTGRVPMTVPRGALLGASVTSPTSNPSFSSRTCASIRVMPVTVGTVTMRCPPLTTSVILLPSPSRVPGGSDCSRTVPFGAELLYRCSPCSALKPACASRCDRLVEVESRHVRHLHVARNHAGRERRRTRRADRRARTPRRSRRGRRATCGIACARSCRRGIRATQSRREGAVGAVTLREHTQAPRVEHDGGHRRLPAAARDASPDCRRGSSRSARRSPPSRASRCCR